MRVGRGARGWRSLGAVDQQRQGFVGAGALGPPSLSPGGSVLREGGADPLRVLRQGGCPGGPGHALLQPLPVSCERGVCPFSRAPEPESRAGSHSGAGRARPAALPTSHLPHAAGLGQGPRTLPCGARAPRPPLPMGAALRSCSRWPSSGFSKGCKRIPSAGETMASGGEAGGRVLPAVGPGSGNYPLGQRGDSPRLSAVPALRLQKGQGAGSPSCSGEGADELTRVNVPPSSCGPACCRSPKFSIARGTSPLPLGERGSLLCTVPSSARVPPAPRGLFRSP